jgi:hypothetical protein
MRDKLQKLRVVSPDDVNFESVVESLRLDLFGHIADANVRVFSQLEHELRVAESESLATAYCEKRNARSAELAEGSAQTTAALVEKFLELPGGKLEELDPILGGT